MQSDQVFVHNRVGLLAAMNYGRYRKPPSGADDMPVPVIGRLPSPGTDSEEDKGYKSWEVMRGSNSEDEPSPTLDGRPAKAEIFMPPPATANVLKRVGTGVNSGVGTPTSKISRGNLITSTPNIQVSAKNAVAKKNILPKFGSTEDSLNWESEEELFSQQLNRTQSPAVHCDQELCECQSQIKFSFAIKCEEGNSTLSERADVESVRSEDEIPFDEDEKVLSGDRLSQMTRTYHDIEAVTHLLEEKERDLELAARIGQTLLQKNRDIVQRNELLEEQLAGALEEVSQLKHEISLKEDLLHAYVDDDTDSSGAPSPVKELRNFGRSGMYNHIESLQVKIKKIEDENTQLKIDHMKYQNENEDLESQEQQLVSDAFNELESLRAELKDARENNRMLSEELSIRNEEAIRQQEEITRLLTQIVDMQRKQKQLALENEELQQHLTAANATQYELTREVQSLEDRYQEVTNMLDETREEARLLRDCPEYYGRSVPFSDSLAAELECSGGMATETHLQDSNPLSFTATPINWSSPPSSVVDGEIEDHGLHSAGKELASLVIRSEPRPKRTRSDSLSQRVLNTARFVNNIKNYSMNSRFQYATPKKQDRPIPTPLPIPGSNRSAFVHGSPDSTPSSGRCMSSTPHDKHKHGNLSAFGHSRSFLKNSLNLTPKYASLRLQLANKSLAKANHATSIPYDSEKNCNLGNSNPDKPPRSRHNHSASELMTRDEEVVEKRAERTWHGESAEGFDSERNGLATPSLGRPGIPGTEDLERAIRKLALRRENARYMEMEKRLAANESFDVLCNSGTVTPSSMRSGGRTPPPSAPGSPKLSRKYLYAGRNSALPKLRIVKPLEGSATLNQWKYLAERDRTLPPLQTKSDMLPGIITRDRVVEALSKSRDGSLNSSFANEPRVSLSYVTPVKSTQTSVISDSPMNASLHPPQAASSPPPNRSLTDHESTSSNIETHKKDVLQISPICPGKGFPLTATRYTYVNSRVMNPSDDLGATPPCTPMVQSTVYCNTYTSTCLATALPSTRKSKESHAYLSTLHPFLTGQPNSTEKAKQTKLASKFFKENTKTCSMQLGLAQLFKEHGVNGLQNDLGEAKKEIDADVDLDSPPVIGGGKGSAFTSSVTHPRSSTSRIVWNRSLQRTFLLPSTLPSKDILFNLNRRSEAKKPETPPNSPLTSVPSSASFLLNEILAETPTTTVAETKEEDESSFSSNLLSKLAQIGRMGLQGLGRTSKTSVATTASSVPTYTTAARASFANATTSSVKTPHLFMSRCATAPGSLRSHDDTDVDSVRSLRRFPSRNIRRSVPASSADDGITLKPTQTDWAELHGSSGALNLPSDSNTGIAVTISDGYLDEETGSEGNEVDRQDEGPSSSSKTGLRLNLGKKDSNVSRKGDARPSTRPKTRAKKK